MDKENGWDASANWNGYMYQGKVALLVALTKINEISDVTEFWLESEGIEDFSIGKGKGEKKEYELVHQVKNRKDNKMENYNEALSNIVKRIRDYPGIKRGFLHIKNEIITDNWKKRNNRSDAELLSSKNTRIKCDCYETGAAKKKFMMKYYQCGIQTHIK